MKRSVKVKKEKHSSESEERERTRSELGKSERGGVWSANERAEKSKACSCGYGQETPPTTTPGKGEKVQSARFLTRNGKSNRVTGEGEKDFFFKGRNGTKNQQTK